MEQQIVFDVSNNAPDGITRCNNLGALTFFNPCNLYHWVEALESNYPYQLENSNDSSSLVDMQGARNNLPPNFSHFYVIAPLRHHVDILRKCIHALND